jgi:2-iminobutanoate/2-iminopropanoate deaminase
MHRSFGAPGLLAALLLLHATACGSQDRRRPAPTLEYVATPGSTPLPFSAGVRVGAMLYLSGQLGTDSTGRLASGGIGPERAQALENIRILLERHGSGMDRVVKCTAMLADMAEWAAMNREYVRHFPGRLPARSAFGTAGLALGARVEPECMAVADRA